MNAAVKKQITDQMYDLAANDLRYIRTLADELIEKQDKKAAAYEEFKRIRTIFDKDPVPFISNEELNSYRS